MDVDSETKALTQAPVKHPLPEIEIFCYLLLLVFLIDQKKYGEVMYSSYLSGVFLFCLNCGLDS